MTNTTTTDERWEAALAAEDSVGDQLAPIVGPLGLLLADTARLVAENVAEDGDIEAAGLARALAHLATAHTALQAAWIELGSYRHDQVMYGRADVA